MSRVKFVVPALVLMAGLALNSVQVYGKPEYTKKEKKGCVACHVSAKSKDLNATGECYKKSKSLEGCPVK
jgi:hypothetical protein